jgi:hypothetical protein
MIKAIYFGTAAVVSSPYKSIRPKGIKRFVIVLQLDFLNGFKLKSTTALVIPRIKIPFLPRPYCTRLPTLTRCPSPFNGLIEKRLGPFQWLKLSRWSSDGRSQRRQPKVKWETSAHLSVIRGPSEIVNQWAPTICHPHSTRARPQLRGLVAFGWLAMDEPSWRVEVAARSCTTI